MPDQPHDVAGVVAELLGDRRDPEQRTDREHPQQRSNRAQLVMSTGEHDPPGQPTEHHGVEGDRVRKVRDVRLGGEVGGDDDDQCHPRIAGQHEPGGDQRQHPQQHPEVRIPGMGQHVQPVAADGDRHQGAEHDGPTQTEPAPAEQHDRSGTRTVDHDAGELHAPRAGTRQPVEGCNQIEAPRARVAALIGEVADSAR